MEVAPKRRDGTGNQPCQTKHRGQALRLHVIKGANSGCSPFQVPPHKILRSVLSLSLRGVEKLLSAFKIRQCATPETPSDKQGYPQS